MKLFIAAVILLSTSLSFAESAYECVVRVKRQHQDPQIVKSMMEKCISSRVASKEIPVSRWDCLKAVAEFPTGSRMETQKEICLKNTKYETATACVVNAFSRTHELPMTKETEMVERTASAKRCILDRLDIMSREDCIEASSKFPTDQEKIAQNKFCQDFFAGFVRVNGINVRPKQGKQ